MRFTIRRLMVAVAFVAVLLGLVIFIPRAIRLRQNHHRLAVARLKAARGLFAEDLIRYEGGTVTIERPYLDSVQELDSELDVENGKTNRVAALKGHLMRMISLQQASLAKGSSFDSEPTQMFHGAYYRAEAESWLAKAEADW